MRNTPPSRKPPPTGRITLWPISSAISMAGISRDHTEAAHHDAGGKPQEDPLDGGAQILAEEVDGGRP